WKYLGMVLTATIVRPQKIQVSDKISTLHDVQKLVGDIQWVRNMCGVTNTDLAPLFELLRNGTSPAEP
ncbi:POK18 protein, partial [Eulacestoma nigropectus]|nr:POK18 protein [Eulacestoma nigropectus]